MDPTIRCRPRNPIDLGRSPFDPQKRTLLFFQIHAAHQRIFQSKLKRKNGISTAVLFGFIHPYIGFTLNPASNFKWLAVNQGGFSISLFGLLKDK